MIEYPTQTVREKFNEMCLLKTNLSTIKVKSSFLSSVNEYMQRNYCNSEKTSKPWGAVFVLPLKIPQVLKLMDDSVQKERLVGRARTSKTL